MTEPIATRPLGHERRAGPVTPDARHRASYETGESSASGSLRNATPTTDRAPDDGLHASSSPADTQQGSGGQGRRDDQARRRHRHRSSGTFLLHDAVAGERDQGHRRQSRNMLHPKARTLPRTPEQSRSSASHEDGPRSSADRSSRPSTTSPQGSSGEHSDKGLEGLADTDRDSAHYQQSPSVPDLDSTQIVNMALNLSESRRIASRRTISRSNPPRLAPLPDAGTGSSLRQHLQQQRKTSRNMSPKSGQFASPGIPSSGRANSPLQPAFDESPYRYQFSHSTLARAQKAKEHLELMAQYRRLLETLPPLKPGQDRDSATPPTSPIERRPARFGATRPPAAVGRIYNPLQYIRNRKVRARERKVIDGDRQGFGDVESVRAWVDQISKRSSLSGGSAPTSDVSTMPAFPSADELGNQTSPDSSSKTAQRARRPRVDWFMEPCDMVADAYWLEQDHHKNLIEDRNWTKIYPPAVEIARPMSGQTDDLGSAALPLDAKFPDEGEDAADARDFQLTEVHTGLSQGSTTRERAKQKLQDFKFPHRHSGSVTSHHDFLRIRRDSASDLSGSDTEDKNEPVRKSRHGRSNTISSNTNELLEKQMLEMIAKEARDKELEDLPETEAEHQESAVVKTPERQSISKSPNGSNSRTTSRKASVVDTSDSDHRPGVRHERRISKPVIRSGRQSLEVPDDFGRRSYEYDSSLPNSPELAASRGHGSIPTIGADFSPNWSRAGSPTRNPISRVKQKLRERNREAPNGSQIGEAEDDPFMPEPASPSDGFTSHSQRPSSPLGKLAVRPTGDSQKGHRSTGSLRLRGEDQGVGLRGMFKGPRIDTVLRGSVSKLGDMLWKKEGSSESPQDPETTDESDSDAARGRRRTPLTLSRRESKRELDARHESKNFLDAMPQFHQIAEVQNKPSANGSQKLARPPISRTQSRQLSRFDMLKPPRLDVRSASSSVSPPSIRQGRPGESDFSDSESYRSSVPDGVRAADKRLNSVIGADANGRKVSRHWSITDRTSVPARAQVSKREVARMRALILSSGIKAMEISRRAYEPHRPFENNGLAADGSSASKKTVGIAWHDIARLMPEQRDLHERQALYCELYPLAARSLAMAVQASGQRWQASADRFTSTTSVEMQNRIWTVRTRIADDLSNMTRKAADEADETSKDLALDQPLKVKHVVDIIEKMLRKRRRRLRWVRRALWLTVEWLLIGFMWYVWFVVMLLRVVFGVGKGIWTGVRWLLWL